MDDNTLDRIMSNVDSVSGERLQEALKDVSSDHRALRGVGSVMGALVGAAAGGILGKSTASKSVLSALGGLAGGTIGYGASSLVNRGARKRVYDEVLRRRKATIDSILNAFGGDVANKARKRINDRRRGIQTKNTEYGNFTWGAGTYSDDDDVKIKRDKNGDPVMSLLFAGVRSKVLDSDRGSEASAPLAELFYNKNSNEFSDVQSNTIFDDPVVADAYIDKIVAKISDNRKKTGRYPKMRIIGYSAGGRGVVSFLRKMRERDPNFKVDEIIGMDPYLRPWEDIPENLSNPENPVADRIIYARPASIMGSRNSGMARARDVISSAIVRAVGKKLEGLSGGKVTNKYIPGITHTDAEIMYRSALDDLANGRA